MPFDYSAASLQAIVLSVVLDGHEDGVFTVIEYKS